MPNHTDRPLSPHMQVWRWHVTMTSSIFHRASGVALAIFAAVFVCWLWALATGPEAFAQHTQVLASPLGKLGLIAAAAAAAFHFANGIRHLVWDAGKGYEPKIASTTAWLTIACGCIGAVAAAVLVFGGMQ